jgi:molybdenum cofactor biosynthesis protein A
MRLAALRRSLLEHPPTLTRAVAKPLQPLSASALSSPLVDSHGRPHSYLRISLTERCNLRCTYCMPASGVPLSPPSHLLQLPETLALASHFVSLGVSKIRLTGGEPTLRADLVAVVEGMGRLRAPSAHHPHTLRTLALTSNGVALGQGPLLPALWASGLDALNLSLDTLQPELFARLSRRPPAAWASAWRAVHRALELGWGATPGRPLKVNTVVQRGVNDGEAAALVRALTQHHPVTLRFIEFMPFSGNEWVAQGTGGVVPSAELLAGLQAALPTLTPLDSSSSCSTEGSGLWKGHPDWKGSFGFISTVSSAFCASCSRLRLTADGSLRVCLHGEEEVSLRDVVRGGGDLTEAIARAVQGKHAALGGKPLGQGLARSMIKIGG